MGKKNGKILKRTIKFLSHCKQPELVTNIIAKSPNNVVKSICNAALNAAQGQVILKKRHKGVLSKYRNFINQLVQKGQTADQKRKIIHQTGSGIVGLVIPVLLSAVLSSLGSRLFN